MDPSNLSGTLHHASSLVVALALLEWGILGVRRSFTALAASVFSVGIYEWLHSSILQFIERNNWRVPVHGPL